MRHTQSVVVISVPDTNAFLEYRFFTDIPWTAEMGAGPVDVLITLPLLKALDRRKGNYADRRKQEIARTVLARLTRMLYEPTSSNLVIREGERVVLDKLRNLARVIEQHDLDRDSDDDEILASALQAHAENPDAQVVVYSGDLNMLLKAQVLGLASKRPTEALRLTAPADPLEAENDELRRRVQELEAALPKLSFQMNGQRVPGPPPRVTLPRVEPVDPRVIDARLAEKKAELEGLAAPRGYLAFAGGELQRFRRDVDEYLPAYRTYLMSEQASRLAQRRSLQVRLVLLNEGTAPADDVDVTITYPELILASRSVELDDIWDLRKMEPKAPQGPRNVLDAPSFDISSFDYLAGLPHPKLRSDDSGPDIHHPGRTIRYHLHRVKHGMATTLDPFYLCVAPEWDDAHLVMSYELNGGNLPKPSTGKLTIAIETT